MWNILIYYSYITSKKNIHWNQFISNSHNLTEQMLYLAFNRLQCIFKKCEAEQWWKSSEESYRSRWLYSRSWHARGHHHPWHHRWHHAWHLIKEASWNIHLAFPYHLVQAEVLRHSVKQGVGMCVCVYVYVWRAAWNWGWRWDWNGVCSAYLMVWCHSLWSVKQPHTPNYTASPPFQTCVAGDLIKHPPISHLSICMTYAC